MSPRTLMDTEESLGAITVELLTLTHVYRYIIYTYLHQSVSSPHKPCFHQVDTALPGKSFLFCFLSFSNQQLILSYRRGEACPDASVCSAHP